MHLKLLVSCLSCANSTFNCKFSRSKRAALNAISSSLARLASLERLAASLFLRLLSLYVSSLPFSSNVDETDEHDDRDNDDDVEHTSDGDDGVDVEDEDDDDDEEAC